MEKKTLKIKGEDLTQEYILERAAELTTLNEQVTLITNYLGTISASVLGGNGFSGLYFLNSGALSNVVENLQSISDNLAKISNSLCVDE